MDKLSQRINTMNVDNIRSQIAIKKGCAPYHATINQAAEVTTDYDTFPYPRWWRGVTGLSQPVIAEREAGYRPRHDNCYKIHESPNQVPYPNHCFEAACSTVYPCYPSYLNRYADREALDIMLNNSCIVQYR